MYVPVFALKCVVFVFARVGVFVFARIGVFATSEAEHLAVSVMTPCMSQSIARPIFASEYVPNMHPEYVPTHLYCACLQDAKEFNA